MANDDVSSRIIQDEEEFLDDVQEYMTQRGVPFERDGKVAGRPIPLHALYIAVMEKGGYDKVTATRMVWREITKQFPQLPVEHEGAMSYQLKMLYYKNLAAYEIEKFWGEKPPAPNMLENTTAKGGEVRKRTHDNMTGSSTPTNLRDSDEFQDAGQQTPVQEKAETDEQGSANRYPSRLRQQPKPNPFYQPDPTPSRVARMRTTNSPQPAVASYSAFSQPTVNFRNPNFKIENYEPSPSVPLALKPVVTPGSNRAEFYTKTISRPNPHGRSSLPQDLLRNTMGRHPIWDGPNIYTRCVQGLKSNDQREQDFALHHLVKVSHERGDKFKLEGFPTLAEAILEKLVDIAELAWGATLKVSYDDPPGSSAPNTINAVYGTENFVQHLAELDPIHDESEIEPEQYVQRLEKLNEAALVLRNMVCLEENAIFLSKMAFFRDILLLMLNLPKQSRFSEIRQYGLDIAEMSTRYWDKIYGNDVYLSLVKELLSDDRGKILAALRALYRFDAEADRIHPLNDISVTIIQKLVHFCLLDDDELVEASINLLFAWTAFSENLSWITETLPDLFPSITLRLTNLLMHGAEIKEITMETARRKPVNPPVGEIPVPITPPDLHQHLLHFPEPERSSRWLRCCFEEAPDEYVTQISIWQAYSQRFIHNNHTTAADFIKTVSSTINGAQAQVTTDGQGRQKFIIKGIRPRRILIDPRGASWFKCQWQLPLKPAASYTGPPQPVRYTTCSLWCSSPENLWKHLVGDHGSIPRAADGKFQSTDVVMPEGGFKCSWVNCGRTTPIDSAVVLATHLKIHVPETAEQNKELIYKLAGIHPPAKDETTVTLDWVSTPVAADGHPYGIALMSGVLLTNIARYIARQTDEKLRQQLTGKMFSSQVRGQLIQILSKHRTLNQLISDLVNLIMKAEEPNPRTVAGMTPSTIF